MIYTLGISESYRSQEKIVYDHQILVCRFSYVLLKSVVPLCLIAFIQIIRHCNVFNGVLHLTGILAQCACHVRLSAAGGSEDKRISAVGDVEAGGKAVQYRHVDMPFRSRVQAYDVC